jgi:hypothetical protein
MSLTPCRLYKVDLHTSVYSVAANNACHRLSHTTLCIALSWRNWKVYTLQRMAVWHWLRNISCIFLYVIQTPAVFFLTRVSEIHNVEVRRAYDVLLPHVDNCIHTLSVKPCLKSKYEMAWGHGSRRSKHRPTINYWSDSTSRTTSATCMNVCKRSVLVKQVLSLD